jgi:Tol biopolymer transport system component
MQKYAFASLVGFVSLFFTLTPLAIASAQTYPQRVSVASDGTEGNNGSYFASVSADGRYVAFISDASNLIPNDTNGVTDAFVYDRVTGTTERVSVASDGREGNENALGIPSISPDGRYVAFASAASNLVPNDTNGAIDVFIHDRVTGTTERISVASDGSQGDNDSDYPAISADGRYVSFWSRASNLVSGDTNGGSDIYVHDRVTGTTERVSVASDGSQSSGAIGLYPKPMSSDGRYVAFDSAASNLVPNDTNNQPDVFVHDRVTGTTERVSVASDGSEASDGYSEYPSISADGRYISFVSSATNLVPGDTNGASDVFVHDRVTGTTERVSVASDGTEGNGEVGRLSSISSDGRYVTFDSAASSLVPDDTNGVNDVFVHDRVTGTTARVSVNNDESQANGNSNAGGLFAISADNHFIGFASDASSLVPADTNGVSDVFVTRNPLFATSTPTITTTSLPDATINQAYSQTLQATSGTAPYVWSITSGNLPAALSLATSTGVISGTPTMATSTDFVVQVTDANAQIATTTLTLIVNPVPVITTKTLPDGTQNVPYTGLIQSSGGSQPFTWSITSGALPSGLTLDATTGVVSGTTSQKENIKFTVQLTDANGVVASQEIKLKIKNH